MDPESIKPIVDELLDELFSNFEPLEAQNTALLQFLKAKGLATDEELAPFLKQAADGANVRWLAVRIRTAALIANLIKPEEKPADSPTEENTPEAQASDKQEPKSESSQETKPEEKGQEETQPASDEKNEGTSDRDASPDKQEKAA